MRRGKAGGASGLTLSPSPSPPQSLRAARIDSELEHAAATKALEGMRGHEARLAARFEALLRVNDGLAADREALQSAREVALNDVDLLLRLRMGQSSQGGRRR